MTRRDRSHNVLEVEHTEGTERWLVIKRMLEPKKVHTTRTRTGVSWAVVINIIISGLIANTRL